VKLHWRAIDRNLEEQPIRLLYSVDGESWKSVCDDDSWLPNTGTYAWNVPAGLPHEVHLRVQARDKAGNVGEARSPSKFSVDLVAPEGRISGVVESGPEPRVVRQRVIPIYDGAGRIAFPEIESTPEPWEPRGLPWCDWVRNIGRSPDLTDPQARRDNMLSKKRVPSRGLRQSSADGGWTGSQESLVDAWELFNPTDLDDCWIPTPSRPAPYLSNRHASYLEQLPLTSSNGESPFLNGPMFQFGPCFQFDYVPDALPRDWQVPQF
jgi:hypothetical protein